MSNREIELKPNELCLTLDAIQNYQTISLEAERRNYIGLTSEAELNPTEQVADYLARVKELSPEIDFLVDSLIGEQTWKKNPQLVICMPVVGTGDQEIEGIKQTLAQLNTDAMVQSGDAGIVLFVNRPEGFDPDETASVAKESMEQLGMNGIIINADIAKDIGNTEGPFQSEMATKQNEVPIGLIRDIISLAAMKLTTNQNSALPLLIQMDADYEGLMKGSFEDILRIFADQEINLLQCTSDWDSREFPREQDSALLLGANLMRELPQILKLALNNKSLTIEARNQILFGEAIQRGIQVPQVERMESIARKGGYGLNRLAHDELDSNIRQTALLRPQSVRSTANVTFLWNNRRAVRTWQQFKQPPISQWVSPFSVVDPVRNAESINSMEQNSDYEIVVNKTLKRFPLPKQLPGVYTNFSEAVINVTANYIPAINNMPIREEQTDNGLSYLQIEF